MRQPTPEERQRIVSDAMSHLPPEWKPERMNDIQQVVSDSKKIHLEILKLCKEIKELDESSGGVYDPSALRLMIYKLCLDSYSKWDKEKLEALNAAWQTDKVMEALQ